MHTDKRAEHKHSIRQVFHRQLKHHWATNKFLREHRMGPGAGQLVAPPARGMVWGEDQNKLRPMSEVLASLYTKFGYSYVPLVREDISLACSLRVLFLRRDFPASVLSAGDIDNRLKTLIDALRMPQTQSEVTRPPEAEESPFFVLLDDDRQITHLEVETDAALAPGDDESDMSFARIVITVELRPYNVTMFNLSFA